VPELPEVETVCRTIRSVVLNKQIASCQVNYPRLLPKNDLDQFVRDIQGRVIVDLKRRGKYIIFDLDSDLQLIVHLRMTGQLLFCPDSNESVTKHTSAILYFTDGSQLRFVDQRKFGTFYLLRPEQWHRVTGLHTLGVEPLAKEFTVEKLKELVKRPRNIKSLLLDQKCIAGLGNIYVDESLFRTGIHPQRQANSLTDTEITKLHVNIIQVLQEAIASQGTTIKDYRTGSGDTGYFQNKLLVYGKAGEPCVNCNQIIEKIRVAGRGTHYCPNCQRWDQECEA